MTLTEVIPMYESQRIQRRDGSMLSQDVPYDLVRTEDGWRVRIADEG